MKKFLWMAAAVLLISAPAQAQEVRDWHSGMFFKLGGGWNHTGDQDYIDGANAADIDVGEGYAVSGAVGYDLNSFFRPEVELVYRNNEVQGASINGIGAPNAEGDAISTALMLNGYVDIPTQTLLTPYIGAGIGAAHVKFSNYSVNGINALDDSDTVLAWQLMAGAQYASSPDTSLFAEYKYFRTNDINVTTVAGNSTDIDYDLHSVIAGVKFNLP